MKQYSTLEETIYKLPEASGFKGARLVVPIDGGRMEFHKEHFSFKDFLGYQKMVVMWSKPKFVKS